MKRGRRRAERRDRSPQRAFVVTSRGRGGSVGGWRRRALARMARRKAQMGSESIAAERPDRLASLVTLSHEPMLAWRLDGSIEFWNAGAERLYGFASDEAIGRSSHSLLQTKFPIEFAEVSARLRDDGYWS